MITLMMGFLANRNMTQIYGGLTRKVDFKQFNTPGQSIYIENVNVLSVDGAGFVANQTVHIENGLIVSIDTVFTNSKEAMHIDGGGKFLIPGLIDSHVHLFKSPNDLLLYVANGVTEIREMIGEEDHLKWRQEIRNGSVGPDMYVASPRLGSFGQIEGWWMQWTQGFDNIRDAKEAEAMVKAYAAQGFDAVKVYSYLNKESYEAINKVAIAQGMDVVGHVPFSLELDDVLSANQSEIAHVEEIMNAFRRAFGKFNTQEGANEFLSYVDKRSKEVAPMFIENSVSVTTTVWLTQSFVRQKFELEKVLKEIALEYENPGISEWDEMIPQGLGWLPEVNRYKLPENMSANEREWQKIFWNTYGQACQIILKNLADSGVSIMAGTDANLPPTVPGFSLHDELMAMNEAGMSAVQVLQSATAIPAEWMGSNTGKIKVGYKANLVLLEKNPLDDISNTRSINMVIHNGKLFDKAILNKMLEAVKDANASSRKKDIDQFTTYGYN